MTAVLEIMPEAIHYSVMCQQVLSWLNLSQCAIVLDCTLGLAGHSYRMLELMPAGSLLVGMDKDAQSLEMAKQRLAEFGGRCILEKSDFINLDEVLNKHSISTVDAILFDLGISSFHLDTPERGFSFLSQGPLDMRMDQNNGNSALDLINTLGEEQLADLIWKYGEERFSRRIARAIVRARIGKKIETTTQLAEIISGSVPAGYRYGRIHPSTRTFQAIRIAVNRELERIEPAIEKAVSRLRPKARLAMISFHSLEDRIVKHTFKRLAANGIVNILTKKPVLPSDQEISQNNRSRSAKLRVVEKI